MIVGQCIEEYGSGLNYNLPKWNRLLDDVMEQKVKTIVITHKDRFIRFGYDWFEKFCMNLHTTIYEKYGYEMKYIRPPKGEYSERTVNFTNTLGYKTVMWSFAYDDWDEKKQGRKEYAKEKILKNIHNGAVILLHGNSKDNVNVLDYCIKEIKKMGYEFKSLDEFER